jgi:hypothetical protein
MCVCSEIMRSAFAANENYAIAPLDNDEFNSSLQMSYDASRKEAHLHTRTLMVKAKVKINYCPLCGRKF